jgi:hypothetical protein
MTAAQFGFEPLSDESVAGIGGVNAIASDEFSMPGKPRDRIDPVRSDSQGCALDGVAYFPLRRAG